MIYSAVLGINCGFVTVIENSIFFSVMPPGSERFLDSIISQDLIDSFIQINQDTINWNAIDFNIAEEHVFIRQAYIDSIFQNRNTWQDMTAAWYEINLRYNSCGIFGVSQIAYNTDSTVAFIYVYHGLGQEAESWSTLAFRKVNGIWGLYKGIVAQS